MKLITGKILPLILVTFAVVMMSNPLMAQVYKTVDKDGNVTYTDQPPGDGSKPVKLRPISVIETPVYERADKAGKDGAEGEDGAEVPLRELRRQFTDFAIVAPQPEESIWHPQAPITVAWSVGNQLQPGMRVSVFVDGVRRSTSTDRIIPVIGLERGEHTATAELIDSQNRKIATATPVTFFIRQPTIYTNRARPGGG